MILSLPDIEIRDMSIPAIIAGSVAPTQGSPSAGTLVLVAISAADKLLDSTTKSSLILRLQDTNSSGLEKEGTIVAGPLLLSDWISAENEAYFTFVARSGNLKTGSSKLVQEYSRAIQVARSAMEADDEGGAVEKAFLGENTSFSHWWCLSLESHHSVHLRRERNVQRH